MMMRFFKLQGSPRSIAAAILLAAGFVAGCKGPAPVAETVLDPNEWRQWRGPGGQGISPVSEPPLRWTAEGTNVRWQTRIPGSGNSSPIVSGGKVFVTTTYAQRRHNSRQSENRPHTKRVVVALDLETGETLWDTIIFEGPTGKKHFDNTHAAPTPVTDGRAVFAAFDAHVAALDFDGNILWKKDLDPAYYETSHYGVASSPVLTGNALIYFQDREEGSSSDPGWLVALDKATGDELWRRDWMDSCCSYTSPIVARRGGSEELIVSGGGKVVGYDPANGDELWRAPQKNIQPVPTPVLADDLLVLPGAIHSAEVRVYRLVGTGKSTKPEFLWKTNRAVPDMASPLLYGGKLYTITNYGVLSVYEPETGELLWRRRLRRATYRSALLAADDKIYAFSEQGLTVILGVARETPRIIRENMLPDGSNTSPALTESCLLLRGENYLYCVDQRKSAAEEDQVAAADP